MRQKLVTLAQVKLEGILVDMGQLPLEQRKTWPYLMFYHAGDAGDAQPC